MLPGSSIVAAPMMRWRISDWPYLLERITVS